jgi:hypothetical protein
MSVPIDRLYHYIENIAHEIYKDPIIIYRFYPHGSKKIEDLSVLHKKPVYIEMSHPPVYCYDQEPLNFDWYVPYSISNRYTERLNKYQIQNRVYNIDGWNPCNVYDKSILIHSEQRSDEVEKYFQNNFIPVYYWSHAVIARDWFRYAEHIKQHKNVKQKFLVYNRAWSGTREYRLQFANFILRYGLDRDCRMNISPIEPELGIHYDMHTFANPQWRPTSVLENYFPISNASSNYSADFDIEDYEATDIEVVLETLFDDTRLHLTEKSLRPIACGQPFILAGTHGSLEYLRRYGFKTFGDIWNEQYDTIEDPHLRLLYIADEMRKIANWSPEDRATNMALAQEIADYNRRHFFSKEFFELITNELKRNLKSGLDLLENTNTSEYWWSIRLQLIKIPDYKKTRIFDNITRNETAMIIKKARKYIRKQK